MLRRLSQLLGDRRGSVLAIVAMGMPVFLGMVALTVDLGAMYVAHAELQRAADAAALAGASAFLDYDQAQASAPAEVRAIDYATRQRTRDRLIDTAEVYVEVMPDSSKVRVYIQRHQLETFFARIFGVDSASVSAKAAAQATPGGSEATCVKPFAVPDRWAEDQTDDNTNRIWDQDESWVYDPELGDQYYPLGSAQVSVMEFTGYGSNWAYDRNGDYARDYGRPITIKAASDTGDPSDAPVDSFFFPFVIPSNNRVGDCKYTSQNISGADPYRSNICQCNMTGITLGTSYQTENGDMEGPTFQGVTALVKMDRSAYWDGYAVQSDYGINRGPRVITVALFDPNEYRKPGKTTIKFNNFAKVFIEGMDTEEDPVRARFLGFVSGSKVGKNPGVGSLVKVLQLVE